MCCRIAHLQLDGPISRSVVAKYLLNRNCYRRQADKATKIVARLLLGRLTMDLFINDVSLISPKLISRCDCSFDVCSFAGCLDGVFSRVCGIRMGKACRELSTANTQDDSLTC